MKDLFASKKFIAAAIGVLAVVLSFVLSKLGMTVPEEKVAEVLGMLAAYVVGQGIADHGKEAAKVPSSAIRAGLIERMRSMQPVLSDTKGNELMEPGGEPDGGGKKRAP